MATASSVGKSQRIRIRLKAFDHKLIDHSIKEIVNAAKRTGARIKGPIPLPTKKLKITTRKSPSGEGKATWEKYEMRVNKRLIDILNPSPKTIDALMNLNLPAGVDVEVKM